MTPLQRYQSDIDKNKIKKDEMQWLAVQKIQRLYDELNKLENNQGFVFSLFKAKKKSIRGLYLWGGTGRGKTYLVDSFYECLPDNKKHRVHFHRFMLEIHQQLKNLPKTPDPLEIIAKQLAEKVRVLCLDEFHVHDIADAMLLAGLLKEMFSKGITLVTTSNIAIHDLYKNGLQRERFMHAIKLLEEHTDEFDLGEGTDYRFNILGKSEYYYLLNGSSSREDGINYLSNKFQLLAPCQPKTHRKIEINSRKIHYISYADDVIWFDFSELCCSNRSASDYIQLAERCHTLLLSDIPVMHDDQDAAAKRFVHLIDALYDHNVKLLVTAHARAQDLYTGQRMHFAFDRTISRLVEMGTEKYLKLSHNPLGTVRTVSGN